MKIKVLGESNSVFNQFMAEIRDEIIQKDSMRFRKNLQRLGEIFDHAENAFISAYRKYDEKGEFHIEFEYLASPSINGKDVILSDPMLASGASMEIGYQALLEKGTPKHVHLVVVIASDQGVEFIKKHITADNVTLWIGAVDPDMTAMSYIVPGLGDAGDLAFGAKIDSH